MKLETRKVTGCGVLIALGVALGGLVIPVGASKIMPAQHLINVLGGVLLGPGYAVINAFLISLLRNILGTGSLLAFPGSMIGAFLSGILFKKFGNYTVACIGEVFGTGVIGAIVAVPIAILVMGQSVGIVFYILPFIMSSFGGALIAWMLIQSTNLIQTIRQHSHI